VLVACGRDDRATTSAHDSPPPTSGPEQLVMQIPRSGGIVRVLAYPAIDSVIWTAPSAVPATSAVLAFDENAGSMVLVDDRGAPVRLDLRGGGVNRQPSPRLTQLASADGWSVFGLGERGRIVRLTPLTADGSASWSFMPPAPASRLVPQPDGSLLVVMSQAERTGLVRMRPPDSSVFASAELPPTSGMAAGGVGDRVYFLVDTGLVSFRPRDLSPSTAIRFRGAGRDVVATPSGDRVYVAADGGREIAVVDRYRGAVTSRIELPGIARELRMDPTGRHLLARPETGDSVWVISLATDVVVGSTATLWRRDLPAVAPDGALAVVRGADMVLLDPQTLAVRQRIEGGAASIWHFFAWSGFRARAPTLDEPVSFPDLEAPADTLPFEDVEPQEDDFAPDAPPAPPARQPAPNIDGFLVQFAALRSEEAAREMAAEMSGDVARPRVMATRRDGIAIFRVIAGPYTSREEAERVGRESGRSYWVYEGAP
jgi:cell division septation protein DedD